MMVRVESTGVATGRSVSWDGVGTRSKGFPLVLCTILSIQYVCMVCGDKRHI